MALSSTQIGAIGENLLINAVMKASDGRLTPFQPLADDDGLDVLFFDKETGNSVAIQLKCRTTTIRKRGSDERGNVAHFQVRQATFNDARRAYLVAALCNEDLTGFIATWFVPMELLPKLAKEISGNWVLRPSKAEPTVHGTARASFSTWAREQTDYPTEVIEAALAHKQPDKVVAAYAGTTYFDRRRTLLSDWSRHCMGTKAD